MNVEGDEADKDLWTYVREHFALCQNQNPEDESITHT